MTMIMNFSKYLKKHREKRYIWLFITLGILLTASPFLVVTEAGRLTVRVLGGFSLFACAAIISPKKMFLFLAALAGVFSVCMSQPDLFGSQLQLHLASSIAALVFYLSTVVIISVDVVGGGTVDRNKLCGAVCIYLLIGLLFAQMFLIMSAINPDYFKFSAGGTLAGASATRQELGVDLTYFSFVTLTTMGYGDILPATPVSRMLAAMEAVVGQIYLAVLVARLVSLYTMTFAKKDLNLKELQLEEQDLKVMAKINE